jgi:hypothetical protein
MLGNGVGMYLRAEVKPRVQPTPVAETFLIRLARVFIGNGLARCPYDVSRILPSHGLRRAGINLGSPSRLQSYNVV